MTDFKQRDLFSDRRTQIKQFCVERGIQTLVHFTRIENLGSILREGLLSRERLDIQGISRHINDVDRIDGHKDRICLSLSFPNYKMFYSIREQKRTTDEVQDSQWTVLILDAELLWELDCAFCQENASSNRVRHIPLEDRKRPNALRTLFDDEFHDETREVHRQSLAIPANYPTNPQAEILVFDRISSRYIKEVIFFEFPALRQWESGNVATYTQEYRVDRKYFYPRNDHEFWSRAVSESEEEPSPENILLEDDIPF